MANQTALRFEDDTIDGDWPDIGCAFRDVLAKPFKARAGSVWIQVQSEQPSTKNVVGLNSPNAIFWNKPLFFFFGGHFVIGTGTAHGHAHGSAWKGFNQLLQVKQRALVELCHSIHNVLSLFVGTSLAHEQWKICFNVGHLLFQRFAAGTQRHQFVNQSRSVNITLLENLDVIQC